MPDVPGGISWDGMGDLPTLSEDADTRREQLRARRLRIYRVALPAGVPLMLFPLILHQAAPYLGAFDRTALPLLAVVYVALAALSHTRVALRVLDAGIVVSLSAVQYGRLASVLGDGADPTPAATLAPSMPWLVAVLVINAWVFYDRPRVGVAANFALLTALAVMVVSWWPDALPAPQRQYLISALLQLLGLSAGVVAAQVLVARQSVALMLVADRARQQALTDVLTGLPNRRALLDTLARRADVPGELIAVAIIDVDHFKAVNDTHGHALGDEVLRAVAGRLAGQLPAGGVVGRYGGEEFLAVLPVTREGTARALCESLRAAVEAEAILGLRVTVSVGVAVAATPHHPVTLLEVADTALYAAKAAGRNTVRSAPVQAMPFPGPAAAQPAARRTTLSG